MRTIKYAIALLLVALLLIVPPTELAHHAIADDATEEDTDLCMTSTEADVDAADWRETRRDRQAEQEPIIITPPAPSRWTDTDVAVISRMVWGEGRGVSRNEQKLIVWTVINRLEDGRYGNTLSGIVRARGQFHGYSARHPVTEAIRKMVIEVLEAWERGEETKIYPPFATSGCYRYFWGDGRHNWFRTNWRR